MKNIKRKRIRYFIRSPLFLFIGFSVLYFVQTAIAQEAALSEPQPTPDIINRGDAARLAAELEKQQAEQSQSNSPAKVALEEARAAKQAAEQALANAQTKLEEAIATQQGAQDQLTTAQTTLDTATTVQQQAQAAADEEAAATTEALRVAQAAVDQAQQEVGNAQTTLDQAQSALDALNQQIAVSKNKVNEATATKESAKRALQTALAKVQEFTGQPVDGGSNPTNPGDGGTGNIAFTTITPKLLEHDCKEPPGDSTTGVLGDPEEMVDGNPRTNFTCKGLFTAKFALAEKMVIDAVNVQSEHEFPSFTGNTAKVYVDDKEVAEQDIPTHCQTCELLPTRVDFDNVEGQFITIEFTKALPNEKNAIESEIAEVSVVAGKR